MARCFSELDLIIQFTRVNCMPPMMSVSSVTMLSLKKLHNLLWSSKLKTWQTGNLPHITAHSSSQVASIVSRSSLVVWFVVGAATKCVWMTSGKIGSNSAWVIVRLKPGGNAASAKWWNNDVWYRCFTGKKWKVTKSVQQNPVSDQEFSWGRRQLPKWVC